MKVKFYLDLSESMFDYNKKCADGTTSMLMATTNMNKLMDGYERVEFTLDLPNRFFYGDVATITAIPEDVKIQGVKQNENR